MIKDQAYHGGLLAPGSGTIAATKNPNNTLHGLLEQALAINARIAELNEKMCRDVSRICGSWPIEMSDVASGPETDGIIAMIHAVLSDISRKISETEDTAHQLSKI